MGKGGFIGGVYGEGQAGGVAKREIGTNLFPTSAVGGDQKRVESAQWKPET